MPSTTQDVAELTLAAYQNIYASTEQLLAAANEQNWDLVIDLAHDYKSAVDGLRRCPSAETLDDECRTAQRQILMKILENDAKIVAGIKPELTRLERIITSLSTQKSVSLAYGPHQSADRGSQQERILT